MPYATDDLTPVLVPQKTDSGLLYGEGKLLTFNPETLENEVAFRGTILRNLRIQASGFDALTWEPGNLVALHGYAPRQGAGVWWIASRIIAPGPGAADVLLAGMTTTLAKQLSAEVFAERVHVNSVDAIQDSTSSSISNFTDLATVGPTVSSVPISSSGKALVIVSADINLNNVDGTASIDRSGYVGYEITGATSISASIGRAGRRRCNFATHNGANPHTVNEATTVTKVILHTDLNEGDHTFQIKYSATHTGFDVNFGARVIVVMAY